LKIKYIIIRSKTVEVLLGRIKIKIIMEERGGEELNQLLDDLSIQ